MNACTEMQVWAAHVHTKRALFAAIAQQHNAAVQMADDECGNALACLQVCVAAWCIPIQYSCSNHQSELALSEAKDCNISVSLVKAMFTGSHLGLIPELECGFGLAWGCPLHKFIIILGLSKCAIPGLHSRSVEARYNHVERAEQLHEQCTDLAPSLSLANTRVALVVFYPWSLVVSTCLMSNHSVPCLASECQKSDWVFNIKHAVIERHPA